MIYCLYNVTTNALLGIGSNPFNPLEGQQQVALHREMPDLTIEEWNPATLNFFTKTDAFLTHLEWRARFTQTEQELIDELNATFETNDALSVEQKRKIRTGLINFNAAKDVNPKDARIPPMLDLYTALGYLAPGRAAEILA